MNGKDDPLVRELYFLIYKFLEQSPCTETTSIFKQELERLQLLPFQLNPFTGTRAPFKLESLISHNPHITSDYLFRILQHASKAIEQVNATPIQTTQPSFLGSGRFSLLRSITTDNDESSSSSTSRFVPHSTYRLATQVNRVTPNGSIVPSTRCIQSHPAHFVTSLFARELSGPKPITHLLPTNLYERFTKYRRLLGHLASIYCLQFDKTGRYVFTGADDSLIKIWSATNGRLLMSLRGHQSEISDLAVNMENTMLASGGIDHVIRVWCLKTTAPITVLTGHTGVVTAVNFCPLVRPIRYLASTSEDGNVCFWKYDASTKIFDSQPIKFTERTIRPGNKIQSANFSSGGVFFAVGSTDQYVRVYHMTAPIGPTKILEITQHCSAVDSIYFANYSTRFISGSRDGIAHIWSYEKQTWKNLPLRMNEMLPGSPVPTTEESRNVIVNNMCWSCDDAYIIVSVSDFSIKVWNSRTAKLFNILRGHEEKVYTLDPHPKDFRILLSAGHDGAIFIWDLILGTRLQTFLNVVEGQGVCEIYDCKWSPDGMIIAATDIHGHISFFGFGRSEDYKKMPDQVFFHTDYRPLLRDANQYVIDEQTQIAPHLMSPPFLVDIEGNPHPPEYQRLVPGREACLESQLIPYVADSFMELQPPQVAQQRLTIDDMIQQLQNHGEQQAPPPPVQNQIQQEDGMNEVGVNEANLNEVDANAVSVNEENQRNRAVRNAENAPREGVRQSQNFLSIGNAMKPVWHKKPIVESLNEGELCAEIQRLNSLAEDEELHYALECKKRPEQEELRTIKEVTQQQRFTRSKQRVIRERRGVRYSESIRTRDMTINELENFYEDYDDERDRDFDGNEAPDSSESETTTDDDSDWDNGASNSNSRARGGAAASARGRGGAGETNGDDDDRSNRPRRSEVEERENRRAQRRQRLNEIGAIRRRRYEQRFNQIQEMPERYRPPEWLTDTKPKRTPYFPQIGDEVVYFRSGHQNYIDVVKDKKFYNLSSNNKPFKMRNYESDEIFARIVNIKYNIKPPRLVLVKLNIIDPEAENPNTNISFTVRYHDVENVVDFIILKKLYDLSIARDWKVGDEFRSVIDDRWWFGIINSVRQVEPYTWFQCFNVTWSNGDTEYLSPWDMEPIIEEVPEVIKIEGIAVSDEERLSFNLINENEWNEEEKQRLLQGLARIMEFAHAEDFNAPVDLNVHPAYATVVPYMMDLSTIRARIENNFYRRKDMIRFDIGFIEANAEIYNEPESEIVKKAKIISTVCRRFVDDEQCFDPLPIYLDVSQNWEEINSQSSGSSSINRSSNISAENDQLRRSSRRQKMILSDSDNENHPSIADQPSTSTGRGFGPRKPRRNSNEESNGEWKSWKHLCRELLDDVFTMEDSLPFRAAVDPILYPDYLHVIDTPMDLSTVKEQLLADNYESVNDFAKDMRLIFSNSRQFNTKKKSLIYKMTNRLSEYFEKRLKLLITQGKSRKSKTIRSNFNLSNFGERYRRSSLSDVEGSNSRDRPIRKRISSTRYRDYEQLPLTAPTSSHRNLARANQKINNSHCVNKISLPSTSNNNRRTFRHTEESSLSDKYGLRKRKRLSTKYREDDSEVEESDDQHEDLRHSTIEQSSTSNYQLRRRKRFLDGYTDEEEHEEEVFHETDEDETAEENEDDDEEEEEDTENEEDYDEAPDDFDNESKVRTRIKGENNRDANDSDATQVEEEEEENKENTGTSSARPTRSMKRVHYEEDDNESENEVICEKRVNDQITTRRSSRIIRSSFSQINDSSLSSQESGSSRSSHGTDFQLRRSSRKIKRRKLSSDSEIDCPARTSSRIHKASTSSHLPDNSDLYSAVKTRHRQMPTEVYSRRHSSRRNGTITRNYNEEDDDDEDFDEDEQGRTRNHHRRGRGEDDDDEDYCSPSSRRLHTSKRIISIF